MSRRVSVLAAPDADVTNPATATVAATAIAVVMARFSMIDLLEDRGSRRTAVLVYEGRAYGRLFLLSAPLLSGGTSADLRTGDSITLDGAVDLPVVLGPAGGGASNASNALLQVGLPRPRLAIDNFGYDAGGWRVDQHPRFVADITGDGRGDIVGFRGQPYVGHWTGHRRDRSEHRGCRRVCASVACGAHPIRTTGRLVQ
jgi:hypothetical protein